MIEKIGNLWDFYDQGYWITITTNGFVKTNGEAVMGRGCALECKQRFPHIPLELGSYISKYGNRPYLVGYRIITLPVKHAWYEKANLKLIEHSLLQFKDTVLGLNLDVIYMPRPGCGNGKLDWETQVKPICEKYLNYRFVVLTKE